MADRLIPPIRMIAAAILATRAVAVAYRMVVPAVLLTSANDLDPPEAA